MGYVKAYLREGQEQYPKDIKNLLFFYNLRDLMACNNFNGHDPFLPLSKT